MLTFLIGYRTYIAAVGIVAAATSNFLGGDSTLGDTLVQVLAGLGLGSMRAAIAKK